LLAGNCDKIEYWMERRNAMLACSLNPFNFFHFQ
jgi:hypothetical protein